MPHIFTLATPAGNEEIDRLWTNAGDEIFDVTARIPGTFAALPR